MYAIWNTKAGGNSSTAVTGTTMGTYYPGEIPSNLFDNDLGTVYTSYGPCSYSLYNLTRGEKTGFYLTLKNGSITMVAFYMGTNSLHWERDPLTITIEGSNLQGSALVRGSSWTLIYNDSSGLNYNKTTSTLGAIQIVPSFPMAFASYRLLVTAKKGIEPCASYSEFGLLGY